MERITHELPIPPLAVAIDSPTPTRFEAPPSYSPSHRPDPLEASEPTISHLRFGIVFRPFRLLFSATVVLFMVVRNEGTLRLRDPCETTDTKGPESLGLMTAEQRVQGDKLCSILVASLWEC